MSLSNEDIDRIGNVVEARLVEFSKPAHASDRGAINDAEYVLRWMKQCRDFGIKDIPDNIIGLQQNVLAAMSQRTTT